MSRIHRHIAFIIVALLLAGAPWGAYASPSKKHTTKRAGRHTTASGATVRPPVIDTTTIDSSDVVRSTIVREINRWSSVRYKKGGVTLRGADCSGFVLKVFQNSLTVQLPRTSREQAKIGEEVDRDDLQFGDLVFFYKNIRKKTKRIGHVGIYVGDGNFVHSSRQKGVGVDALSEVYYSRHFAYARRVADFDVDQGECVSGPSSE